MKRAISAPLALLALSGVLAFSAGATSSSTRIDHLSTAAAADVSGAHRSAWWNVSHVRGGDYLDDFDSYTLGSDIIGQGGWEGWAGDPNVGALVDDTFSASSPHSLDVVATTDVVHPFSTWNSGSFTISAQQYIPAGYAGESYFILQNTYPSSSSEHWSTQLKFNSVNGLVESDGLTAENPVSFVIGEWAEIRVEVDLDADSQSVFYNDQLLYTASWTSDTAPGGALNLGAIDLFGNGASSVYYDDIMVVGEPPEPEDCIFADGFEEGGDGSCDGGGGGPGTNLSEGFEDAEALFTGENPWIRINNSEPVGPTNWSQNTGLLGTPGQQAGSTNSSIFNNFEATTPTGVGTISSWLLTPEIEFSSTTTVSFWTRAFNPVSFPDRLEMRVCSGSPCTDVGTTSTDVGEFTTLLVSVNPNLVGAADPTGANGYPQADFAQFTADASDGLPTSGTGRIAFRYFVTDSGGAGSNGSTIGVDTVEIQSP